MSAKTVVIKNANADNVQAFIESLPSDECLIWGSIDDNVDLSHSLLVESASARKYKTLHEVTLHEVVRRMHEVHLVQLGTLEGACFPMFTFNKEGTYPDQEFHIVPKNEVEECIREERIRYLASAMEGTKRLEEAMRETTKKLEDFRRYEREALKLAHEINLNLQPLLPPAPEAK